MNLAPISVRFDGRSYSRQWREETSQQPQGARWPSFDMKTSLVIALTAAFVLAGGSALRVMNKACK